jgi:sugar phosphate isomerase/epimerase
MKPTLRHIANLWSLVEYPSREDEWSLERKLRAVKEAGFDGFTTLSTAEHRRLAKKFGLMIVGYFASGNPAEFTKLLRQNKAAGAHHINVQLADEDTLTPVALGQALRLFDEGRKLGIEPAVEVHRDTCTETPEKVYALADAYEKVTGELLPITWDFSHIAVVKHLAPTNFIKRLIVRPDLIQRAQQFHFRPFNGHHCQVPVTDAHGNLTQEVKDWLPFAAAVLKTWLASPRNSRREIFVCPEMGPVAGGYNLRQLPNSWEDAVVLRAEIAGLWSKLTRT